MTHTTSVGRKLADVGRQALANVLLVIEQGLQREGAGVVKSLLAFALEDAAKAGRGVAFAFVLGMLLKNLFFGALEHAVQAAQKGRGKDDLAVVGGFVVVPQEVGDGLYEIREF